MRFFMITGILACLLFVAAAEQVVFTGKVLDREGKLVPDAEINLFYQGGKTQVFSDEYGEFTIIVDADDPKTATKDGIEVGEEVYFDYEEDIELRSYTVQSTGENKVNLTVPVIIDDDEAAQPRPEPIDEEDEPDNREEGETGTEAQDEAVPNQPPSEDGQDKDQETEELPNNPPVLAEANEEGESEQPEGVGLRMVIAIVLAVALVTGIYYFMNRNVN